MGFYFVYVLLYFEFSGRVNTNDVCLYVNILSLLHSNRNL